MTEQSPRLPGAQPLRQHGFCKPGGACALPIPALHCPSPCSPHPLRKYLPALQATLRFLVPSFLPVPDPGVPRGLSTSLHSGDPTPSQLLLGTTVGLWAVPSKPAPNQEGWQVHTLPPHSCTEPCSERRVSRTWRPSPQQAVLWFPKQSLLHVEHTNPCPSRHLAATLLPTVAPYQESTDYKTWGLSGRLEPKTKVRETDHEPSLNWILKNCFSLK